MDKKVYLKEWNYDGDKVKLEYKDDSILFVKRSDFDRAFGCIVSASKDVIIRDFAIENTHA